MRHVAGLVDCGFGPNRLLSACWIWTSASELSFVYVTHEHSDHIRALPALTRAGVPVVTGSGTARALGLSNEWLKIAHGKRFECGGIEVTAVRTSHDAAEPLGAVVRFGGVTAAVFTDMGAWDGATVDAMTEADIIVVEANHNIDMLKRGPYPAHLKRRVLSDLGHLSNDECGRLTETVRSRSAANLTIYLAHLSQTNNTPPAVRAWRVRAGPRWLTPLRVVARIDLLAVCLRYDRLLSRLSHQRFLFGAIPRVTISRISLPQAVGDSDRADVSLGEPFVNDNPDARSACDLGAALHGSHRIGGCISLPRRR